MQGVAEGAIVLMSILAGFLTVFSIVWFFTYPTSEGSPYRTLLMRLKRRISDRQCMKLIRLGWTAETRCGSISLSKTYGEQDFKELSVKSAMMVQSMLGQMSLKEIKYLEGSWR